jgi:hypothetical protein
MYDFHTTANVTTHLSKGLDDTTIPNFLLNTKFLNFFQSKALPSLSLLH